MRDRLTVREAFDLLLSGQELSPAQLEQVREARQELEEPADEAAVMFASEREERIHPRHTKRQAVFEFGSMIRREDYETYEAYLDARQWEVTFSMALMRDMLGRAFLVAAKELAGGINFGDPNDPSSNRGRVDEAFRTIYDILYGV